MLYYFKRDIIAATRLGKNLEYRELTLEQASKKYGYKTKEEIFNAASEASTRKNKINTRLVNKVANSMP